MSNKRPAVYIITNKRNGTLYIGVTSNLPKRIDEHKSGRGSVFTTKYKLTILIYAEYCDTMMTALEREKQLKAGSRKQKLDLIEKDNPHWEDILHMV
jgi:putative endonuclease